MRYPDVGDGGWPVVRWRSPTRSGYFIENGAELGPRRDRRSGQRVASRPARRIFDPTIGDTMVTQFEKVGAGSWTGAYPEPVACWKQPHVPDSGAAALDLVGEPTP